MSNFDYKIEEMQEQLDKLKSDYEEALQFTNNILKRAQDYRIEFLGINRTDERVQANPWDSAPSSLFAKERDENGNLQVWRLARDFFPGSCGNSEQYQIPHDATVVDGIYKFSDGKWEKVG